MKVTVHHADDHLLIVEKPAGVLTLAHGYRRDAPYLRTLLEPEWGPVWPVYTLEKDVSGLVVLARSPESRKALQRLLDRGEMQRVYHALVRGTPEWRETQARHPLRTNVGRRKRTVVDPRGQSAQTRFRVLEHLGRFTLVEAVPATARRHQVRVHLYTLGHPVAGDPLYGPGPQEDDPIDRPALHLRRVVFPHPFHNQTLRATAAYPQDFQVALDALRMEQMVDTELVEGGPE